ncbi:hypothetical protein ACTFIY_000169 [Dictyostelium cf. discoideum]
MNNNDNFEILFWKVFKNIFLLKYIFKEIKSKQIFRNYSYNEINRVEWMIRNGYCELLIEKIKKCEYLVFNCEFKHPTIARGSMMVTTLNKHLTEKQFNFKYSIFNYFKDDFQLFSILFKNYNLYFQLPSSCKHIERISVQVDNMAALKVLVENYSFKPDISSFFKSYEIGSISVSQYLYELLFLKLKLKLTKDQIETLWNLTFSNTITKPSSSSKFISILINDSEMINDIIIKKLLFIVNVLKLKPTISNLKPLESFFNFKIFKESLSKLLMCCKIVSILSNFQSFHQIFNLQFSKEKTYIEDIKIKTLIKNSENSLLMSSVLNLKSIVSPSPSSPSSPPLNKSSVDPTSSNKIKQSLELISLILFDEINKMKFSKKELSSSVYTLIDNLNNLLSSPSTFIIITSIENIKKLFEMFIKFTTFGKNNLFDNFTFFKIKFFGENESFDLKLFKLFSNQSIIELFRNDRVEIIEKLCKENKLIINQDVSPYYNMKSIEMFNLIYKYDKEKHSNTNNSIFQLLLFNYKIANHFKQNYNNHYQTLIKSATINIIPQQQQTNFKNRFNFQNFNFIFENWFDFTNEFKNQIANLVKLKISICKIPLTDYIKFIEFFKTTNNNNDLFSIIPFYKRSNQISTISNEDIELDFTTFEQVSYLIDKEYYQIVVKNSTTLPIQSNAQIYCIYYLRGELDKIIPPIMSQFKYDIPLVIKEIVKKSDIKSFQYIISKINKKSIGDFIDRVLSYSLFYGNFIIFHKSLNQEVSYFSISDAFEYGQIETILYFKNQLNYKLPNNEKLFEKLINDNNCFFFNYFKNLCK